MKRISFLFLLLSFFITNSYYADKGGRCNGSANCKSCTNCKRCGHCKSGGSCGACSGGSSYSSYSKPSNKKSTVSTKSGYSGETSKTIHKAKSTIANTSKTKVTVKSTTANSSAKAERFYTVKSATLNIRKEPSVNAEIICTVHHKKMVRIISKAVGDWIKIETFCENNRRVNGYVHKSSLK